MVNFGKNASWLIAKVSFVRIFDKSERSKTSKNSLKIVVILQNFGRFLSLRPEIVLISPKFPKYRVIRENLFISEIDQSLGSIWHFPQKSSPKRTIIYVIFSEKSKNARTLFDHSFFCTGAWAIVVAEKFSAFKNFLSLTNLFRILLCITNAATVRPRLQSPAVLPHFRGDML